jgi:hypothetical protein
MERQPLNSACANSAPLADLHTRDVTPGKVKCGTKAFELVKAVVPNAVRMMDCTIRELTEAREAVCRGEPLDRINLREVTGCWLRYKLGACITLPSVWTGPSVRQSEKDRVTIAEIIRRLVKPRDLLASNAVTYQCETSCAKTERAFVNLSWGGGRCFSDLIIHLCPPFFHPDYKYHEQTIIHEAVHITHCAGGKEDKSPGTGIGKPECLAQFVMATNGRALDPDFVRNCTFTDDCGWPMPRPLWLKNCGIAQTCGEPVASLRRGAGGRLSIG